MLVVVVFDGKVESVTFEGGEVVVVELEGEDVKRVKLEGRVVGIVKLLAGVVAVGVETGLNGRNFKLLWPENINNNKNNLQIACLPRKFFLLTCN